MWKLNLCLVLGSFACSVQGDQRQQSPVQEAETGTHEYDCFMCITAVEHAFEHNLPTLRLACESLYGISVCRDFDVFKNDFFLDSASSLTTSPRAVCEQKTAPGTCSDLSLEAWRHSPGYHGQRQSPHQHQRAELSREEGAGNHSTAATATASTAATATVMDVRVSKAYGSRVRPHNNKWFCLSISLASCHAMLFR